jgi:hypothetical protein
LPDTVAPDGDSGKQGDATLVPVEIVVLTDVEDARDGVDLLDVAEIKLSDSEVDYVLLDGAGGDTETSVAEVTVDEVTVEDGISEVCPLQESICHVPLSEESDCEFQNHPEAIGCCLEDVDCDDGRPCTKDTCDGKYGICKYEYFKDELEGCCASESDCTNFNGSTDAFCKFGKCFYVGVEGCVTYEDCGPEIWTLAGCVGGHCFVQRALRSLFRGP